ncbi:MAG: acyl-CoA thioesterase [Phascolarctobacterium sp.]|nr:acyl-CoA thioesterase [Phascolarctobacterium sp.]
MITVRDRVRFVETDTMGVVHHSIYLHWFEMGRAELLRAADIGLNELMEDGVLFPIAEVDVKYKNSCMYDDEYEVQTSLANVNRVKMEFEQRVIRLRDGAVAAEALVRNVFTDKNGRVTRISSKWMERLQKIYEVDNTKE